MKKRKILSLLISLCLLISLLPTVALAAYPDSNEAGFKLETDSYTDGVLTVSGHVKLPTAEGISSFNVVLSWDSAVLTLLKRNDANVKYTPTNSKTAYPLSIETFLINGATEEKFGVSEADLYGEAGRAGFKINLYSTGGSIAAQKTTDWVKAFAIKFEVSGKPTDASTVLNSDSLRIADPVKDAGVIKGAFPANNTYTIQVQDAADPAKIYNYGKMAGNSASETEANNFMMAAAGNNTATYPGSTPVTPPTTYTVSFSANGGSGTMAADTGISGSYTLPACTFTAPSDKQFKGWATSASGAVITDTSINVTENTTLYAIWEPIPPTTYTVSFNANGGSGTMAADTGISGSYTLPACTFTAPLGQQFKGWARSASGAVITGTSITVTADTTLYAIWETIPATEYTITFNGNGGTPSAGTMSTAGGKLTSLPTATRSGSYSFDGWYTAASGGTQITTAYVFSANTTVYAHWTYTGGGGSYYAPVVPDMPMLYRGCTGDAVKTLQEKLNAKGFDSGNVDGIFGAKTYAAATAFQKANGLGVDGIVGKLTWAKLYDATPVNVTPVTTQPMLRTGSRGDAVRKLQELLNAKGYTCGSVDGIFGSKTYAAVLAFQKANGLAADGIVGSLTWGKLV